jgi:hypothetical protein
MFQPIKADDAFPTFPRRPDRAAAGSPNILMSLDRTRSGMLPDGLSVFYGRDFGAEPTSDVLHGFEASRQRLGANGAGRARP